MFPPSALQWRGGPRLSPCPLHDSLSPPCPPGIKYQPAPRAQKRPKFRSCSEGPPPPAPFFSPSASPARVPWTCQDLKGGFSPLDPFPRGLETVPNARRVEHGCARTQAAFAGDAMTLLTRKSCASARSLPQPSLRRGHFIIRLRGSLPSRTACRRLGAPSVLLERAADQVCHPPHPPKLTSLLKFGRPATGSLAVLLLRRRLHKPRGELHIPGG